jgi:carbon monoxide dehydrogenase subunit G
MEFHNDFDVQAPIEQVWATVLDVERVAPCVPGAQVLDRTGDDAYRVAIKLKLGPLSMQYRGQVEIVDQDPSSHRAVMSARAQEARGQGMANAEAELRLSGDGGTTHGTIATRLQLSGKAAAMGQGVIQDVSARIVNQFAQNLAAMLAGPVEAAAPTGAAGDAVAGPAPGAPVAAGEAAAGAAPGAAGSGTPGGAATGTAPAPAPPAPAPASAPPAPPSAAPAEEGLDILSVVWGMVAERMRDPRALIAALGGAALAGYLAGRRRRR